MMNKGLQIIAIISVAVFLSSCASMYLKDGKEAYNNLEYDKAIHNLEKGLAKKEDAEAQIQLANSYMRVNRFDKAKSWYETASLGPNLSDEDRLDFGRSLMSNGLYEQAEDVFDGILSRTPDHEVAQALKSSCRNIDDLYKDSAMYSVETILIPEIDNYFAPVMNNGTMYFSSAASSGMNKDPYTGVGYLDLYSTVQDGSSWKIPSKLEGVNGKYHDGIATISADGNRMILTRSYYDGKSGLGEDAEHNNNTQLYISGKNEDGSWSMPELLPFSNVSYMFAHPSLSVDGGTLYFSSDLQGGRGGMDLYSSNWDGVSWSDPVNLGGEINSIGDDVFPHSLSADTLYFSSDSRSSLGGLDILYSVKRGNSWSIPYHMGYPLNSPADDFGIAFNDDHSTGYLSSDRYGNDRIYSFEMFDPELVLKGFVANKKDFGPIEGILVTVENITDGTIDSLYTDENGSFILDLAPGKNYRIKAEDERFLSVTENISTIGKTDDEEIEVVLELEELVITDSDGDGTGDSDVDGNKDGVVANEDGTYDVPNIYWDYNKWDIRPDAEPYLNDLVKTLKDNKDLKVEIQSHCDCRGSHFFNDQLSKKRAKAVVNYVVSKGVSRSMVKSKGYGERRLVNECKDGVECSEAKHQENRRTEFIVTERK